MGRKRRILVVDDDPLFAEGLTALLMQQGYSVVCCYSGRECIEKLREFAPEVIVSDHVMGDLTGLQLIHLLTRDRSDIPFIVLTGFKTRSLQRDFEEAGAYAIISKSEASRRLLDIIEELFGHGAPA